MSYTRYIRNTAMREHEDAEKIITQLRKNGVVKHAVEWHISDCKNYIMVKTNDGSK